jgi:5-methylcytosine-specific restriction endonuclease McrA
MTVKEERVFVWMKYASHCAYCGKLISLKEMQVDHYHPKHLTNWTRSPKMVELYKHPAEIDDISNKMPSCRRCNHYKRGYTIKEFRQLMETIHERIAKIYIAKVAIDFGIITLHPFKGKFYFEQIDELKEIIKP